MPSFALQRLFFVVDNLLLDNHKQLNTSMPADLTCAGLTATGRCVAQTVHDIFENKAQHYSTYQMTSSLHELAGTGALGAALPAS